jgi:hypothetical protein
MSVKTATVAAIGQMQIKKLVSECQGHCLARVTSQIVRCTEEGDDCLAASLMPTSNVPDIKLWVSEFLFQPVSFGSSDGGVQDGAEELAICRRRVFQFYDHSSAVIAPPFMAEEGLWAGRGKCRCAAVEEVVL